MKHIKLYEEFVNESILSDILIPAVTVLTMLSPPIFAMWLGTEAGHEFQRSPSFKDRYKKWKSDNAVQKIVTRLQEDDDIKQFLLLPSSKQKGQWQKLITSKLTDSEMAYLKRINKGHFDTL
jgi:hypothetical protein